MLIYAVKASDLVVKSKKKLRLMLNCMIKCELSLQHPAFDKIQELRDSTPAQRLLGAIQVLPRRRSGKRRARVSSFAAQATARTISRAGGEVFNSISIQEARMGKPNTKFQSFNEHFYL